MSTTRRIEIDLTPTEIDQLREVMDAQPLRPYTSLIVKVLKALPLESAACPPSGADSSRPAPAVPMESGRGFRLQALTPRGREMLPEIERLLARLPHGGGSL